MGKSVGGPVQPSGSSRASSFPPALSFTQHSPFHVATPGLSEVEKQETGPHLGRRKGKLPTPVPPKPLWGALLITEDLRIPSVQCGKVGIPSCSVLRTPAGTEHPAGAVHVKPELPWWPGALDMRVECPSMVAGWGWGVTVKPQCHPWWRGQEGCLGSAMAELPAHFQESAC